MLNTLSYKIKQFFFVLIKLSLVVGTFYFIYNKLANNNALSFNDFMLFSSKNNVFSPKNIIFLLTLTFFNWFLEIKKWQHLISFFKKISFKTAAEQSLGALTASLLTPNRIGEYGAKAMYYTPSLRKHVMLANLLNNLLQMGVTTLLGIIGFSFYILTYKPILNYNKLIFFFILILAVTFLVGFIIKKSSFKIKGVTLEKLKQFFRSYPKQKLNLGFLLSLMRYIIFSFQCYFILHVFGTNLSYFNAMIIITSMHLLTSLTPSIFIFDVIIKGGVAIYLFSLANINELITLCTITIMWLFNFVLPSLFGCYYILRFNFYKNQD